MEIGEKNSPFAQNGALQSQHRFLNVLPRPL
jgi:hypothetical protein